MTTAEAFAGVYSMIQGSDRISEFYKDSDDYWTGYVETEDGETCFVSMPDWYPEGISIDWSI